MWTLSNLCRSASLSAKGIRLIAKGMVDIVNTRNMSIPAWVLATFNDYYNKNIADYVDDITLNTELRVVSNESSDVLSSMSTIVYSRGFDNPERLLQGWRLSLTVTIDLPGLLVTMQSLPHNSIAIAVSDNPSKNLELKEQLIQMRDSKNIHIFFVFAPEYHGTVGDESWQVFQELAHGRGGIFNIVDYSREDFLNAVADRINSTCVSYRQEDTLPEKFVAPIKRGTRKLADPEQDQAPY